MTKTASFGKDPDDQHHRRMHALRAALRARHNIIIAGAHNSGRTELMKRLIEESDDFEPTPPHWLVLQDEAEMKPRNRRHLFIRRDKQAPELLNDLVAFYTQRVRNNENQHLRLAIDDEMILATAISNSNGLMLQGTIATVHGTTPHDAMARVDDLLRSIAIHPHPFNLARLVQTIAIVHRPFDRDWLADVVNVEPNATGSGYTFTSLV